MTHTHLQHSPGLNIELRGVKGPAPVLVTWGADSIAGRHTSQNSDAWWVSPKLCSGVPGIAALAADGTSGDEVEQSLLVGQLAATHTVAALPDEYQRLSRPAAELFVPHRRLTEYDTATIRCLCEWLLEEQPWTNDEEHFRQELISSFCLRNMLRRGLAADDNLYLDEHGWNLITITRHNTIRISPQLGAAQITLPAAMMRGSEVDPGELALRSFADLADTSPHEIARRIFRPGFEEQITLVRALLSCSNNIAEQLPERCRGQAREIRAGTTVAGLIDCSDSYFLFSIGDSAACAFSANESPVVLTETKVSDSSLLTNWHGAVWLKTRAVPLLPAYMATLSLPKDPRRELAFALFTDGFYAAATPGDLAAMVQPLMKRPASALAVIFDAAQTADASLEALLAKFGTDYKPDDKTAILMHLAPLSLT